MKIVLQIDKWGREIAAVLSSMIQASSGLRKAYHMWVVLAVALVVSLLLTPEVAVLAVLAVVVAAILGNELLAHSGIGAGFRVAVSGLLVAATLVAGILGIWTLYLTVGGLWIGSANWEKLKPQASPDE